MDEGLLVFDMEEGLHAIVCPACGAEQSSQMRYLSDTCGGDWCRCRNCGMEFTIPDEDADSEWASWVEQEMLRE
jgi:transcription elongation factor Elf1